MKKTFLITSFITLLVLTTVITNAQKSANKPAIEFGVKAGLNVATLMGGHGPDYYYHYDARPGMYAGGLVHIHLTNKLALQPELIFSGQGGYYDFDNNRRTVMLSYVNSPVLLQYMFNNGFRLETGPQFGILLGATERRTDNNGNAHYSVSSAYNPVDFSWVFGGGYIWHSGFGVDARVNAGISDVNDLEDNRDHLSNLVFATGIFYQFNHGHTHNK